MPDVNPNLRVGTWVKCKTQPILVHVLVEKTAELVVGGKTEFHDFVRDGREGVLIEDLDRAG